MQTGSPTVLAAAIRLAADTAAEEVYHDVPGPVTGTPPVPLGPVGTEVGGAAGVVSDVVVGVGGAVVGAGGVAVGAVAAGVEVFAVEGAAGFGLGGLAGRAGLLWEVAVVPFGFGVDGGFLFTWNSGRGSVVGRSCPRVAVGCGSGWLPETP